MTILTSIGRGSRLSASLILQRMTQNALGLGSGGFGPGYVALASGSYSTYEAIYRSNLWVYAAVNWLVRGVGRLPWASYVDAEREGERNKVRSGILAELLERPYDGGSATQLKQSIVGNLCLYGNAIVVAYSPEIGIPPTELIPSSWAYWRVDTDELGRPRYYVFQAANGQMIPYNPWEVIHFRFWGPGPNMVGTSPMEPLRRTLQLDDAAIRTHLSSYEKGMRPVGAYSVDGVLKPETATRLRHQLNEVYGGVDNAFKVMLLEGGAKWQPMGGTLVDSELINTRKLTREEVVAAYNVPPPVVGILDRATFSNITEQHIMGYQDTLQPYTSLIEETIQTQLIDNQPLMADQYVEFSYKEVLKGDPVREIESLVRATGGPYLTLNEARATQNLPPVADGDQVMVPLNTRSGQLPPLPPVSAPASSAPLRRRLERDPRTQLITGIVEVTDDDPGPSA